MMKKILTVYIIILSGLFFNEINAQEHKFKAIFIYNFTKYLNWPASSIGDEFIITVLGNNPIIEELKLIAGTKTVLNKKIIVRRITQNELNSPFHILFIPKENGSLINTISDALENKPVLIVTEKVDACKSGAGINFIQKNNNLNFELNKANIINRNISINSQLLSMATLIE